jgi:trehalose 6-phosphate phosphatase
VTGVLRLPPDAALFLDFDGTLVEIARDPELVVVPPALKDTLASLTARHAGALALVSGRAIADLDSFLAPLQPLAAGLHGLERRLPDGTIERAAAPRWIAEIAPEIQLFAARHPGLRVENKRLTIAVHYRGAPELAETVRQFVDACAAGLEHRATVQLGKMVIELRPAGRDKGAAIAAFMDRPPFAGRTPVFVGDDLTDEHGFAAVNRLGGLSIRVGAEGEGETSATASLPDVAAVQTWLQENLRTGTR